MFGPKLEQPGGGQTCLLEQIVAFETFASQTSLQPPTNCACLLTNFATTCHLKSLSQPIWPCRSSWSHSRLRLVTPNSEYCFVFTMQTSTTCGFFRDSL